MIIRKKYTFEAAHIVRYCSTKRCSRSIHGHSYTAEIFFQSMFLDNGDMVVDFGLLKPHIRDFLDSFDHCIMVWKDDLPEFIEFIKKFSERYIIFPVSPTAENISLLILRICNCIINNTIFVNQEATIQVTKVIVHETATGYAESLLQDLNLANYDITDIVFSDAIQRDWTDDIIGKLLLSKPFVSAEPEREIYVRP